MTETFEIFLVTAPGLEHVLAEEAREAGFADPRPGPGGVAITGGWREVWRANLELRGAVRVLARIGSFRAVHLSQLDKQARRFAWGEVLRPGVPVRVEASCKASAIYHDKAAAQRVETALREELGAKIDPDAEVRVLVRIDNNVVTLSLDTSGEPLHKRGFKEGVAKAPMRETLAALFLREAGHSREEPVLDPMCGSGTFLIEAAEMARGLKPGRARRFAFEQLAGFDSAAFEQMRTSGEVRETSARFYGFDRDAGAVRLAGENAERAGVGDLVSLARQNVSDLQPPEGPPGLVIANPPYGGRIGKGGGLNALYGTLGGVLRRGFSGWRAAIITSDDRLAKATGLTFKERSRPVDHGGIKVRLYQTGPL